MRIKAIPLKIISSRRRNKKRTYKTSSKQLISRSTKDKENQSTPQKIISSHKGRNEEKKKRNYKNSQQTVNKGLVSPYLPVTRGQNLLNAIDKRQELMDGLKARPLRSLCFLQETCFVALYMDTKVQAKAQRDRKKENIHANRNQKRAGLNYNYVRCARL